MTPISVTVITLNEEKNIRRCLESVRWADEIVVVDSGSTDQTCRIAREFTPRVLVHDWEGHIQQKNFAVDEATHDWIFSVDADEQVSSQLAESIERLRKEELNFNRDGYRVPRAVHYLGRWIRHGGWYPDYKVRLFNRTKARWGGVNPHDKVMIAPSATGKLNGDLYHYSYTDVADHINRVNAYTTIAARELYRLGHRAKLVSLVGRPVGCFIRMYFLRLGLLDGRAGLAIATIGGFYVFLKYLKLWELVRVEPNVPRTASDGHVQEPVAR